MKYLLLTLAIGFGFYLILVVGLFFGQESLIFIDTKLESDYKYHFDADFEEVTIQTEENAKLNAIHFKVKNPKGIIVYFHGNAGDISRWGEIAERFLSYGYDVLISDYRGYGKSTGRRTSEKMYFDANQVYKYANNLYPEEKIISFGRSLGCTFATYVATKNTPKHLILETPFYSLKSIVQSKFPILPSRLLLRFKFPTHQFIHEVNSPIHFFHGTDDFVVPYENGKALFDLAPNATLTTIFNGGHNDLADFELYWDEMGKLLR